MYLQLITDFKGDKTDEIKNKMIELFGNKIFLKEQNGLCHEIDVNTKTIYEKIDYLKGRYMEYIKDK